MDYGWVMPIVEGLVVNASYASAGYFKARDKKTKMEWSRWLRTVLTGAIPPVLLIALGLFGVSLPPGFEFVSLLGPALDKVLRKWL